MHRLARSCAVENGTAREGGDKGLDEDEDLDESDPSESVDFS